MFKSQTKTDAEPLSYMPEADPSLARPIIAAVPTPTPTPAPDMLEPGAVTVAETGPYRTPARRALAPRPRQSMDLARSSSVRFGLASILRMSDRLVSRIVAGYDRLFQLDESDTADVYEQIGSEYFRDGNGADALAAFHKALMIRPNNPIVWKELGMVHMSQHAPHAAVEAFEEALQLGVSDFEIHFRMAQALADLGNNEAAAQSLAKAAERDPNHAETQYLLGVTLDKLGRYDEAVIAFERAIDLSPRETAYYQSLGFTLETMGDRDRAITCLKRALEIERRLAI